MLPAKKVLAIRRLLDEGELSQRAICRRLKVGRGTVSAIATGKRGLHGRETAMRILDDELAKVAARCPGCGGMVYQPCVLCRTRAYRTSMTALPLEQAPLAPDDPPRRVA